MCLIEPASERLKIAKVEVSGLEVVDAVRSWENCFPPAGRKKTDGAIQAAGRVSRRVWISGDAQPVPSPVTLFGNMLKEAAGRCQKNLAGDLCPDQTARKELTVGSPLVRSGEAV